MLTPKQEEILQFIKGEVARQGYPPSIREIAAGCGFSDNSTSTVHRHLKTLEAEGYIERPGDDKKKIPRAIKVIR